MKKILSLLLLLSSLFSMTAQITTVNWKASNVKIKTHAHNTYDTISAINLIVPNIELVSSSVDDSVNVVLLPINLPKPTKSCDFNVLCSTYSFASSDSIFTTAIGKVLFTSTDANRKIFTTATTGANRIYAVRSATKAITTLLGGYIVRIHYVAKGPTAGTWYISEPIAMR